MRIQYTRETSDSVGDGAVKSVTTELLVIETPDPEPAPAPPVVNITVADAPSFKASQDQLRRNFGTPSPVQAARTALEGKDPFSNEVHFKATPGETFHPCYVRHIPLWAFARQFFVNEFSVLDPRRADAIADHFMEKYRAEWKSDGK